MNKNNIENLVMWLIAGLILTAIGTLIHQSYLKPIFESCISNNFRCQDNTPFSLSATSFSTFYALTGFVVAKIVNLIIAIWLFKSASSKKIMWAALGLVANWWALPIYIYHQSLSNDVSE
jgi:hypothetical protein